MGTELTFKNFNEITFEDFDKLNLKEFATKSILNTIERYRNNSENSLDRGALTLALYSDFGTGKSTFLKMFENLVRKEKQSEYNIFYIDAWRSDFCKEPIIAILSELINYIEKENEDEKIVEDLKTVVGKLTLNIVFQLAQGYIKEKTGFDIKEAINNIEPETLGENVVRSFEERKNLIDEITILLKKYTEKKKLIIIIDELDRARPDYAVHFLEDIKHFFQSENIIFLFGVNKKQLTETIKSLYGNIEINGYLDKFFKLKIDLPDYYDFASQLIYFLTEKCELTEDQLRADNLICCFRFFGLSLRQLHELFVRFELLINKIKSQRLKYIYFDCYAFFICLYVKDRNLFDEIYTRGLSEDRLKGFFKSVDTNDETYKNKMFFLLEEVAASTLSFPISDKQMSITDEIIQNACGYLPIPIYNHFRHDGFGGNPHGPAYKEMLKKIKGLETVR